ncbi:hypothetical protein PTI98_010725 [Pleurotus ostreatus]|nr:hypothetical protein PTI98_010725 [Pleurotus ostreatus]
MTEERAQFLKQPGIDCLISFNYVQYSAAQQGILKAVGITYLWLQVLDFAAASEKQVDDAYRAYMKHKGTLVHCQFRLNNGGLASRTWPLA